MKEIIFNKLEKMIKDVKIDNFNIYDVCEKSEKLKLNDEYKNNTFSYKIFKNSILLKYNVMKKISDFIEIRYINENILDSIKEKFENVQYKEYDLYIRISIDDINQIDILENEIQDSFIEMFLQYMNTEESFGCCSKYVECSDAKHCVQTDVRLRCSCMYKKNLDSGKIFYGKKKKNLASEIKIDVEDIKEEKKNRSEKGQSLIDILNNYTIIDIETTGLDSCFNEIIEISAIKVRNNKIVDEYTSLIKPRSYLYVNDDNDETNDYILIDNEKVKYIDEYISELTGISNKMLDEAPDILDVLPVFKEFIKDDILIGHNVNFDINFLYDNFIEFMSEPLKNNFIDTLRISRKLLPELKNHRLDDLIKYFSKGIRKEHRALNDCKLTNEIYIDLSNMAINKYENIDNFKNQFKKHHNSTKIKVKDIVSQNTEFDKDNPLYNKVCVFTGTLEKMARKDAMQIVVNLGGICGDNVTNKTNYLILGNNDYCRTIKDGKSNKQKTAEKLKINGQDIEIISENVFYDMIEEN